VAPDDKCATLARWSGWLGQAGWVMMTVWRIICYMQSPDPKPEVPPGAL
jgi:hypothetical protein